MNSKIDTASEGFISYFALKIWNKLGNYKKNEDTIMLKNKKKEQKKNEIKKGKQGKKKEHY